MVYTGMGFTNKGLARMREVLGRYVERGQIPGLIAAVRTGDALHVEVLGSARRDTLFRISSMSKPITAVATLMLLEECKLRLDDPIDGWLPELADRRVMRDMRGSVEDTTPAARAITVRDLLTMRAGIGQFLADPQRTPILRRLIDDLNGFGPPEPQKTPAPDAWMRKLGALPLMAQPGERWLYNTSYDVLGVLIARASGQSFERFLEQRIFAPLGMKDSAFHAAPERLLTSYYSDGQSVFDEPAGQWSRPPAFASGGGGLVSTVDDYLAFAKALETGRLISRASLELMTTDHLTAAQKAHGGLMPGDFDAAGYGFGVAVVNRRDGFESLGTYGWDGGMGTSWRNDPKRDLTGVFLTQVTWSAPIPPAVQRDFWTLTYAALEG